MPQPLVSVVIPCFNAGRMLRPALRSIIEQTYPHLEIVFVDNNSTDGSLDRAREIAAGSPGPFLVTSCREQGANHARNLGYGLVRGEYVQWFDADDLLGPDKIARQVAELEREPGVAIAYCDWFSRQHRADGPPLEERRPLTDVADQILRTLSQIWYPPHTYLLRRAAADLLQAERAWWPSRRLGTDVEYSAIAALLGFRFRHVPGTTVCYNIWSNAQLSGAGATPYPVRAGILRDIYRRLASFAERHDIAPRVTARHRRLLHQDWDVWTIPRGSLQLARQGPRQFALRDRATLRKLKLRPREAMVVETLIEVGGERAIPHHALTIAAESPPLADDIAFVIETLDKLRRSGMLTLAAKAAGEEPGDAAG